MGWNSNFFHTDETKRYWNCIFIQSRNIPAQSSEDLPFLQCSYVTANSMCLTPLVKREWMHEGWGEGIFIINSSHEKSHRNIFKIFLNTMYSSTESRMKHAMYLVFIPHNLCVGKSLIYSQCLVFLSTVLITQSRRFQPETELANGRPFDRSQNSTPLTGLIMVCQAEPG